MNSFSWRDPSLTKEEKFVLFLLTLLDDVIELAWSFGGDLQFWVASGFAHSVRNFAREQHRPWYVACMLPIRYLDEPILSRLLLAPDTLVALAPDRVRGVFEAAAEGMFPQFVLEVVSAASEDEDRHMKSRAYALLGAQEYVLFTPRDSLPSALGGFRRDATGAFVPWQPDAEGRLWSAVLGLFLVARGPLLQAQTAEGRLLLTPEQAADGLRRAEEARVDAEEARRRAEEEAERLRRELARLRGDE
jgi:hypothetical protein